ncbi:hypothetical protein [Methanohalophilus profundi]|uniref:hypothetical protein n=1 Tax=Methanohalophilus profundi TaxID=2138083 RepID=UPI00101E0C12|nr:hypothetical protein [Methanohalophilus profundi]
MRAYAPRKREDTINNTNSKSNRTDKEKGLIGQVNKVHNLNGRLKVSIKNDIFKKILAATETEFGLKFTTKRGKSAKGKSEMPKMIRYDHIIGGQ